jgi:hypothetical protein
LSGSAAGKNKAKQSQFIRIAFCVMRIAKRNSKKQSQFVNAGAETCALEGKRRIAQKMLAKKAVICIFLEKFISLAPKLSWNFCN